MWRACGITNETELYWTAIGGLLKAAATCFGCWFNYHKAAPKLEWFQNVESADEPPYLAGLLGLGCLSCLCHQIHISLPVNKLLDAGVAPQEIPLPHELLFNQELAGCYTLSLKKGLLPFFTLNWRNTRILTFKGGLNPITGSLWLHIVLSPLSTCIIHFCWLHVQNKLGHWTQYKRNLEAQVKGPPTGVYMRCLMKF